MYSSGDGKRCQWFVVACPSPLATGLLMRDKGTLIAET